MTAPPLSGDRQLIGYRLGTLTSVGTIALGRDSGDRECVELLGKGLMRRVVVGVIS
jgi:hypothetical protein